MVDVNECMVPVWLYCNVGCSLQLELKTCPPHSAGRGTYTVDPRASHTGPQAAGVTSSQGDPATLEARYTQEPPKYDCGNSTTTAM